MDYEKKYKEALTRAKEFQKSKDGLCVLTAESIFPELKESEDERIRKEIISALKFANDGGVYDKHIAWLEKQKETPTEELYAEVGTTEKEYIANTMKKVRELREKRKENPKSADSIPPKCASDVKCEDRWHKVTNSLPDNGRLVLAQDCLGNTLLARYDGEGNWEVSVYDKDDYYCRNTITKWCEIPSEKQKESLHIHESCKENADSFTDACKDVIVAIEKYLDWLTGYPDYAPKGKYSLRDMLYCLSLLEKQKEQSTKHKTYDGKALSRSYDLGYRKGVADAEKEMYNESGYTPDESRAYDHGYENGYNDGKDEVKQKPAELETLGKPMTHEEWAEDYWEHHKFASPNGNDKCDVIQFEHKGFIDFCMAYCVDQKPQDRLVLHDTFGYEKGRQVGQREGVEMVLKTPESYGLYKPAEWSEEDEKMFDDIISDIEYNRDLEDAQLTDFYNKQIHFLKSLRRSINFQSNRVWNEEDEKMLKWTEDILLIADGDLSDKLNGKVSSITDSAYSSIKICIAQCLSWLKSLRPSWKPSEEQMEALKYVNEYVFLKDSRKMLGLKTLYDDLKKL